MNTSSNGRCSPRGRRTACVACATVGRMAVLAALAVSASGCVQFDHQWRVENRREEVAYQVLHAADAWQTAQIAGRDDLVEGQSAWLLGRKPSPGKVFVWYFADAYCHTMITDYLDQHAPVWVQRTWQGVTITNVAVAVQHNYQLGLSVKF